MNCYAPTRLTTNRPQSQEDNSVLHIPKTQPERHVRSTFYLRGSFTKAYTDSPAHTTLPLTAEEAQLHRPGTDSAAELEQGDDLHGHNRD